MQCPQCQHENPVGARFCNGCGTKLDGPCPECGETNPPGSRFCNGCGARLAAAPPPAPANRVPSPETYTPRHLAEKILTSRSALEGERKQVTVLFADLKGSMELLADRDPEEARAILDPVLERMMAAVHHYEGTVNQVMGDGIMALFGAPLAHEDHAVRACYAALRMQEAVKRYADEVRRTTGLLIQIRVGLNSGEVVVRSVGGDLRMDYTAVGQTTHLAARMEQMAAPGSILLAPDTLWLAEGYVRVKALGPIPIKGLSAAVDIYELVGTGLTRTRLQAAAARGLTRFVGRDAELETLRRSLERAGAGQGQTVALVGEPGVGKSRLVYEFTHSHRAQGWLVLESGSVSYGKAISYLPVIDLLKAYCRIEARDDPRTIREKLTGKLLTLDRALEPTLAAFLALLDLPIEDPAWDALDPSQRRQRTLDACKRLLLRESQEQPLLLVFEDLHWIDAETQALLDRLVESLPTARLLLLVNYRPEYEHTWHRKTYYQQLRLDPLPAASVEELLAALLGDTSGLAPLKRLLIERTEGNPFFLEESVRTLVEAGVLAGERGSHRLAKPFASAQVPATVQAVLAARIDRLPPEDKRLLQSAAVIGKDVPYVLLQAISDEREERLQQGLARLQTAEFLYATTIFPELEYTFKHALTHEVAYGSLLQERRRVLHAGLVAAIERLYPDRQAEQVERLAHHAARGEVWEQAVAYARQAGARAGERSAHREALAYYEQALAALARLPATRATREQAVDLRLELRPALAALAQNASAREHLEVAEHLARELGDRRRLGAVLAFWSVYHWWVGDSTRAAETALRAREIADELDDFGLQLTTGSRLATAYAALGDYRRAVEYARANRAALTGDRIRQRFGSALFPAVNCRAYETWCLAELGEFAAGLAMGHEALGLAEELDHPFCLSTAYWVLGHLHAERGDGERAIAALEPGLRVSERWEIVVQYALMASELGHARALAGQVDAAVVLLEQAVARRAAHQAEYHRALHLGWLGEAHLQAGQRQQALARAQEALAVARRNRERGHEARALRLLGELAAQSAAASVPPELAPADTYYRQALALADELGMRPLVAHCHLGLGTVYQRVGRDDEAQAQLGTAAEAYRAMEMTFWLGRAEAALAAGGAA